MIVGFGSFKRKKKENTGQPVVHLSFCPVSGIYTGQTGLTAGNRYRTGHPVHNTTASAYFLSPETEKTKTLLLVLLVLLVLGNT